MKIAIVYPHNEKNSTDLEPVYRYFREQKVSAYAERYGNSIKLVYRSNNRLERGSYLSFDTIVGLLRHLSQTDYDLYLFKGMGYRLPTMFSLVTGFRKNIGFIVGGSTYDHMLAIASIIYFEDEKQITRYLEKGYCFTKGQVHTILPKHTEVISMCQNADVEEISSVEKDIDIVSISRLTPYTDFAPLASLAKSYRVVVIGDGKHWRSYQDKYPDISFVGHQEPGSIYEFLRRSRILVISRSSGFDFSVPRACLEASAAGIPAIISVSGEHDRLERKDTQWGVLTGSRYLGSVIEQMLSSDVGYELTCKRVYESCKKTCCEDNLLKCFFIPLNSLETLTGRERGYQFMRFVIRKTSRICIRIKEKMMSTRA